MFQENGISHLTIWGYAPVAERTIKAIKAFYEERKKHNTGNDCKQIVK